MRKQVVVIGLGQFGLSVVQSLSQLDMDLLAVDWKTELVEAAAKLGADGICLDATDETALARIAPSSRDVCVCAIGNEAREASFICTALLRQLGARRILARATDSLHEKILRLVGAHEVFNPEKEFGMRVAAHISHEGVVGEYPLAAGLAITELRVPQMFVGKSMIELGLPRKYGITLIALQREGRTIATPDPADPLVDGDVLIVVAASGAVSNLLDRLS